MLKHLRLLPAVIALGAVLLAVKGFGFAHDARAQNMTTTLPAPAQGTAKPDPAAEDAELTSAEVDVLTSLSKRRAAVDTREHALQTREILIQAAEKRVDDKIATLKALQSQIQALLTERDDTQQKQMVALTKTYSSMKPRDAARIFNSLNEDVLLGVAVQMKPDVLGAILGQMQAEAAQKLTVRLANRTKLPESPPAAAQVAMVAPVAAQPGTNTSQPPAAVSSPAPTPTTTPTPASTAKAADAGNPAPGTQPPAPAK